MSDFLAEVDEAMRQERLERLWQDHGKTFIAFIAMTILATAAISGYKSWNANVAQQDTATLISAIEASDFPNNIATDNLKIRANLHAIGILSTAAALTEDGKTEEAKALYTALAQNKKADRIFRDLSILMSARLQSTAEEFTFGPALEKIWRNEQSPWRYHARLETAVITAHQNDDYAGAISILNDTIATKGIPSSLIARANALKHVYSAKQTGGEVK